MSKGYNRRAPWHALLAECYWRALAELPALRPELRPIVEAHVENLRRLIKANRRAA